MVIFMEIDDVKVEQKREERRCKMCGVDPGEDGLCAKCGCCANCCKCGEA